MFLKVTKQQSEEIVRLYLGGWGTPEIANKFKVSTETVRRWLKKAEIPIDLRPKRILRESSNFELIKLFNEGFSVNDISEKMNASRTCVLKRLKSLEADITRSNSQRIYPINEFFFEKINCEDNAYFLGLLYADGNVTKKGGTFSTSLGLIEDDKYLLERLASFIQPSKPLFKNKMKSSNHKQSYSISFASKKLGEDLINLGCIPKKSLVLDFPTREQVPSEFLSHFIRGVFDGDGSFYLRGKSIGIKIVSSNLFCSKLKTFLNSIFIECSHYKITEETGSININNKRNALKFGEFIYSGANILMKRKFKKFLAFKKINNFNPNPEL